MVEHSIREPTFPGSNPGLSTPHTAPFSDACLVRTLVKFLPPCFQRHLLLRQKNSPPTPSTANITKCNFLQPSSTHCSSLDIHWYCLHGTQNLAMWRRKLIKQQSPNISSARDLVDKNLPCSSPLPRRGSRERLHRNGTAHFIM